MTLRIGWFLVLAATLFLYQTHLLIFTCPLQSFSNFAVPSKSKLIPSISRKRYAHHAILPPFSFANDWVLPENDPLLSRSEWDLSPIVIEEFKLIFFTQAKVGCTVWKQLFRRMMHFPNWRAENCCNMLPWNPRSNGLKYLYDYDRMEASRMLQDSNWTKAMFVRDPVERFVSAWLDKAVHHKFFLQQQCCERYGLEESMCDTAKQDIVSFLDLVRICDNAHWRPQNRRLPDPTYWKFISYIGRMETVAEDAEKLLRNIGAWHEFGSSGWGKDGNQAIFEGDTGRQHATSAKSKLEQYISVDLDRQLRWAVYFDDYEHSYVSGHQTARSQPTPWM